MGAEAEARSQLQQEMSSELAREKDAQVARLQKLMEKKLAEGVARQKASADEVQKQDVEDTLVAKEKENAELRQQLAEARQRRPVGAGEDFLQVEELQKLLQLAHGENTGLRETVSDLSAEVNTQAGEIKLLEEKVLGTLSGLRDGGRTPARSVSNGPPRSSSMPSKIREATGTPPRAQPGDIRRLPPQPKTRQVSSVV